MRRLKEKSALFTMKKNHLYLKVYRFTPIPSAKYADFLAFLIPFLSLKQRMAKKNNRF